MFKTISGICGAVCGYIIRGGPFCPRAPQAKGSKRARLLRSPAGTICILLLTMLSFTACSSSTEGEKASSNAWLALEGAAYISDGQLYAPKVVYVFIDPNCDHCHSLWRAVRPWVDAGQLQLRHIPVGFLAPDSSVKAALLLSSPKPCDSLGKMAGVITTGPAIKPEAIASEYWLGRVRFNGELMKSLGVTGTPTLIKRNQDGSTSALVGMPSMLQLANFLGPSEAE